MFNYFLLPKKKQTQNMSDPTQVDTTQKPLTVVGAAWCGYSKKQFDSLGCSHPENDFTSDNTTCKAERADGKQIEFVWCQNDKGEPVNSDHEACKVETTGYPSWVQPVDGSDAFEASDIKGFVPPCNLEAGVLNAEQLNCAAIETATNVCREQEKRAMEDKTVMEAQKSLKDQKAKLMQDMDTALQPFQDTLKTALAGYQKTCEDGLKEAQPW